MATEIKLTEETYRKLRDLLLDLAVESTEEVHGGFRHCHDCRTYTPTDTGSWAHAPDCNLIAVLTALEHAALDAGVTP